MLVVHAIDDRDLIAALHFGVERSVQS